ncbi:MAG TPA: tetratricopeptide repeat protein [Nitrolancea sp.]
MRIHHFSIHSGRLPDVPESRFHIPIPPLTPLFGREEDLQSVQALIAEERVRLVTLTGPPGVGKTRLAFALYAAWEQESGEAAAFVPLSAVSDASLVLPTIAYSLSVPSEGGAPLIERIAATLDGKPALLVLDNFEQVVTAASDVIDLLRRCPRLTIVVTSRATLRVRGEYEYQVSPLALPDHLQPRRPEELASNPAVALLLDRARAGQAGIALTQANAAALAAICVQLEGMPLAIELAAAWLKLFAPDRLLERLSHDLELLRAGARDLPERQRTLMNAIAWSDNLLDDEERRLFHNLAVFGEGWSLAAAQVVCAGDLDDEPLDERTLLDGLSSLLDKSLIQRHTGASSEPRFRMLVMLRHYALRRLEAANLAEAARDRHAGVYLRLAEDAAPHLYGAEQAVWLEQLETELGNLRTALRWLIDRRRKAEALRFAAGLENFWLVHDHLNEGQRWLEEALSLDVEIDPRAEAEARRALASVMLRIGDYLRAGLLYRTILSFAREQQHDALERQTLLDLASVYFISGYLDEARTHFRQVLDLARAAGDWRVVARTFNQLGEIARFRGDDALAEQRYRQSLTLWHKLAERERIAMVLHNLAPVVARLGDRRQAAELFAESLGISRELRHMHGTALCLLGIAGVIDGDRAATIDAARILSAAEALRATIGVQWQPVDRAEFDRSREAVLARLDDQTFGAAWEEGKTLSPDDAATIAMKLLKGMILAGATTRRRSRPSRVPGGLTRREYQVVQQIALGLTNREIADVLSLSEKTIEMHVSHSLTKLDVRSRAQLAAWLVGLGVADDMPADSFSG